MHKVTFTLLSIKHIKNYHQTSSYSYNSLTWFYRVLNVPDFLGLPVSLSLSPIIPIIPLPLTLQLAHFHIPHYAYK